MSSRPKRIACVAPPFAGHVNPMLDMADAAAQAGYQATVITGVAKLPVIAALGLRGIVLPCLGGDRLERIADTERQVGGNPLRLLAQLRAALDLMVTARDELLALWRVEPPDLVVADSVAVAAGLAAEALGLPWITTIATPFALECRRGVPSYVGGWSEGAGTFHRLRDAAGRRLIRGVKRGLGFGVRRSLARLGAGVYRADGSESAYSPTAILGFGMLELEFDRDWPAAFRMIGPSFRNFEPMAPPVLPAGRPRVLVTLGTHLPWAKAALAEDLRWLAGQRPDVSFVGSLGNSQESGGERALAPNAELHPFLPYTAVLPSFDAVIHHGGAGITYAAITAGKPAVAVPHDYDQFDFAARIVAKGAGLRVARLRSPATLAAIDRVLAPEGFPALAGLAAAAARYQPRARFVAEVSRLIGS